jgi:hypothetical protein
MTDAAKLKTMDDTLQRGETLHHGEPKLRQCLRCQVDFHSAWSGERICARCKGTAAWRSGVPPTSTGNGRR